MSKPVNETGLVNAIVRAVKRQHPASFVFKVHGGPMQRAGVADLLLCVEGRFIALEVKHQKPGESEAHARGRATPLQLAEIDKVVAAGGHAAVVLSVDEALREIGRALV